MDSSHERSRSLIPNNTQYDASLESRIVAHSICAAENGANLAHLHNADDLAALEYYHAQRPTPNFWIGLRKINSGKNMTLIPIKCTRYKGFDQTLNTFSEI